jgi:putative transposase
MNRIESEWLHIKEDEIAGKMFEDEYDLAITVIHAVEFRASQKGYKVERFRFNSQSSTA